mgnify:CR=1 FL=1
MHKNLTPSSHSDAEVGFPSASHPRIYWEDIDRSEGFHIIMLPGPAPGSQGSLHVNMKLVYAKHVDMKAIALNRRLYSTP